eukprot:TRINITY_DN13415_c0_g1_i1.p1 TRINITY_DN13415_c0_g1~~TRINITY_DN13415_c0_g1_i1.p1  ORF type:complete len:553 (-),score=184.14 TRINITY_DN13415_c0_g1_i1:206-1864(-)
MCEIDTTNITPEEVFKASGHVTRFNDIMVRDTVTGECIRADKLVEEYCETQLRENEKLTEEARTKIKSVLVHAGGMKEGELQEVIAQYKIISPKNNALSEPFPFNLMFKASIGPEGNKIGYMRPELAQGIILNFKRLMDSGNAPAKLPFAGACIGTAFRNEIAPRAALIRVREFTLAEIEHFVDPTCKTHAKIGSVENVEFVCYSREDQVNGREGSITTIGEALRNKLIDNESVAYFMGRTQLFMNAIGVKYCRFRQHLATEMAHYAQDCWDCELLTSYGFVECVGIADRSAYDLNCHSKASGKDLRAREDFLEVTSKEVMKACVNKKLACKPWGKAAKDIIAQIEGQSEEEATEMQKRLAEGPIKLSSAEGEIEVQPEFVTFEVKVEKVTGRNFTPSVIEPSFGVGRILYALLEQSYWVRRDETGKNEKRAVFSLTPLLAPQKVAILPLMVKAELEVTINTLRTQLIGYGISCRLDDSGAGIGKKYARVDELGIPFCVTCDFEGDGKVTLRERDSATQIRVPVDEVSETVAALCRFVNPLSWDDVKAKYSN